MEYMSLYRKALILSMCYVNLSVPDFLLYFLIIIYERLPSLPWEKLRLGTTTKSQAHMKCMWTHGSFNALSFFFSLSHGFKWPYNTIFCS